MIAWWRSVLPAKRPDLLRPGKLDVERVALGGQVRGEGVHVEMMEQKARAGPLEQTLNLVDTLQPAIRCDHDLPILSPRGETLHQHAHDNRVKDRVQELGPVIHQRSINV